MAGTGRFSRTKAFAAQTTEAKKEAKKKAIDFSEGAKLPWPGVVLVIVGMILLLVGTLFLMSEVTRPAMQTFPTVAGVLGGVLGFGLVFFSFGKWANL